MIYLAQRCEVMVMLNKAIGEIYYAYYTFTWRIDCAGRALPMNI